MPTLFVPEERWGGGSWRANHPLWVQAQINHGLREAGYGYWGFSPANIPEGGYDAYGVDAIGMNPDGYPSNEDRTLVDHGFAGCPGRDPTARPAALGLHQRRGHAACGLPGAALGAGGDAGQPRQAGARLRRLHALGLPRLGQRRHRGGVRLLPVARPGHHHGRHRQRARPATSCGGCSSPAASSAPCDPLIGVEEFNAFPRGCTVEGTAGDDHLVGSRR